MTKIAEELIDNGFKYSSHGTPVQVRSSIKEDKFILEVGDRGRGMTAMEIKRVGAYMQFKREIYEQQGSGLGLAISKRIAELYGGSLTINSISEKNKKNFLMLNTEVKCLVKLRLITIKI